jgi:hypothetical protein
MPGPSRIQVDGTTLSPDRDTVNFVSGTGIDLTAADSTGTDAKQGITVAVEAASLSGTQVAVNAAANVIGSVPVIHRIAVPAGTTGDVDVTLTHKTLVIDAWLYKTTAAGGGAGTITVKNAANAITDAMSININDQAIARATTINDANNEIAAGGTLRITRTRTASTDETCVVFVKGLRVA